MTSSQRNYALGVSACTEYSTVMKFLLSPLLPHPPTHPSPPLQVHVALKGKKLEHHGIRVEFVGQIEMFYDRGNHHDFLSLVRQLDPPGLRKFSFARRLVVSGALL